MFNEFKLGILALAISIFAATAANAYTIDVSYDRDLGRYLVDGNGLTLYYYEDDAAATCNFVGDRNTWPSFYTSAINVPGELKSLDFMTIVSSDGTLQTTYRNWPLYRYKDDQRPGDIKGRGKNVGMNVVSPTISHA